VDAALIYFYQLLILPAASSPPPTPLINLFHLKVIFVLVLNTIYSCRTVLVCPWLIHALFLKHATFRIYNHHTVSSLEPSFVLVRFTLRNAQLRSCRVEL
jgi:hypothetical protein